MFKWLSHSSWTSHGLADVAGGFVHALKRLAAATWKLAGKPREVWDGKSRRERCLSRSRLRLSSFFKRAQKKKTKTKKKTGSYAGWTYFNFPLFFSFLIPLPVSADEQQTVAISNSSWACFVRLPFSVPFVFRCRYGSPERKAVHRLPPGKSSSVCQELAKFIDLVAQGSANRRRPKLQLWDDHLAK